MPEAVFQNQHLFHALPGKQRTPRSVDGFAQPKMYSITGITSQVRPYSTQPSNYLGSSGSGKQKLDKGFKHRLNATALNLVASGPAVLQVNDIEDSDIKIGRLYKIKFGALLALIIITFCGGISIFAMTLRANNNAAAQVALLTEESTAANSDEDKGPPSEAPIAPSLIAEYKVEASLPRMIRISKIKVEARVMQVGLLKDGSLGAPKNTNDASWYTGSSKPGQGGAVLIDGHASGATKAGVFWDLKKLEAGDVISIERGDGTVISYKVVKKQQVDAGKVDMAAALVPVTQGKAGLNLITCAGTYDAKSQTYDQRVVVFAEQI